MKGLQKMGTAYLDTEEAMWRIKIANRQSQKVLWVLPLEFALVLGLSGNVLLAFMAAVGITALFFVLNAAVELFRARARIIRRDLKDLDKAEDNAAREEAKRFLADVGVAVGDDEIKSITSGNVHIMIRSFMDRERSSI